MMEALEGTVNHSLFFHTQLLFPASNHDLRVISNVLVKLSQEKALWKK